MTAYVPLPVQRTSCDSAPSTACSGFSRLHVTVPQNKSEAGALCSLEKGTLASVVGAVNTIVIQDGRLLGRNTDVDGFLEGLREQAPGWSRSDRRAVVVGAGGAARAVVAGLRAELDGEIVIANRTLAKAKDIIQQFDNTRAFRSARARSGA